MQSIEDYVWVDAEDGYRLALADGKLICQNAKGKLLKSVPKAVNNGAAAEQLKAVRDWLVQHDRACNETVETWMLRSLPVPRKALHAVWDDPSWRQPLEDAVVVPVGPSGEADVEQAGFLKGVHSKKGLGLVNLDGETVWVDAEELLIPHPILLPELNDFRELATELGIQQGIAQLFRETHTRAETVEGEPTRIDAYADGKFNTLMQAVGRTRSRGYRVRGGFAVCSVWEGERKVEARYWVGADAPDAETYTGELLWVDDRERALKLTEVGPVAYSEGVRMASAIYAGRVVESDNEDA